ncbi:MAG: ECF transporter S component [Candidatus Electryonea clarkiae]|nr:ECF transporter S component [Candidatus Electryonea clarkiae]MDP8286531.1 ECF transporter S component [Candidatus Electryonea clarkiae]
MTPGSINSKHSSLENVLKSKRLAQISLFTAMAVVCGYILIAVPNVELITVVISLAGLYLGSIGGLTVGILSVIIYNGLNAWGIPFPPVWIAQMVGQGLNGFLFGLLRRPIGSGNILQRVIICLVAGIFVTALFDIITTIAFPISTGIGPGKGWVPFIIAGLPFAAIHLISNGFIFALLLPAILTRLKIVDVIPEKYKQNS